MAKKPPAFQAFSQYITDLNLRYLKILQENNKKKKKFFINNFPENSEHTSFSFIYDYLRTVGRQL